MQHSESAEARNCAMPPIDLRPSMSLTMAVAVLWCAETSSSSFQEISVASPLVCPPPPLAPHTHAHTHFSLHPPSAATAVVRALRWEIKKKLLLSPCRRDGRLFLSLFSLFFFSASLVSRSHKGKWREERKERGKNEQCGGKKESYTACCGVPPHHQ